MDQATLLNALLDANLDQFIGTNKCFIVETIEFIGSCSTRKVFKAALNCTMYQWYYGNVLNKIILMVFCPHLYIQRIEENRFMSITQVQEALRVCFSMIHEHNVKYDQVDYYSSTILQFLTRDVHVITAFPQYIRDYIVPFRFLFRNGPTTITMQCSIVRQWLQRRKYAVRIIEHHWIESLYSPYTNLGKQKMKRLACNFYEK